ncbi:MAG: NAD-dependent epimerase/dehydratase family protein [Actinomycetota bacterium]|nr:NAD-dependent epimerase/dehydratase family protein [Actinomycetota bacterium]
MTAAPSGGAPDRVFITGALGFIGRALSVHYRSLGAEVRGVDVAAGGADGIVAGDVTTPGPWRERVVGCDLVVHTAALVSMRSGTDPFWRANVVGTRTALDAAAAAGARRFLHLSTVTVFGFDFPDGVDERHPVRPNGVPYVDTKIASEQLVLQAHAAGELECTVVRPADVYGPGSRPWTILPVQELKARRLLLPAMGRGIFSPVYIDNLVDGIAAAAAHDAAAGHVLTISDGAGVESRDFFAHYARMLGRKHVPVAPTPLAGALAGAVALSARIRRAHTEVNRSAAAYLTRRGTYSIDKARSMLGYRPTVDLEEGMRRSEAWLRDRDMLS